jgi:hypothetical protein
MNGKLRLPSHAEQEVTNGIQCPISWCSEQPIDHLDSFPDSPSELGLCKSKVFVPNKFVDNKLVQSTFKARTKIFFFADGNRLTIPNFSQE